MTNQSIPLINHYSALIKLENLDNNMPKLEKAFDYFTDLLRLNVVDKISHLFEPIGATLIYIISKSHLAVHTWPEYNLLHLDLVSCTEIKKEEIKEALNKSLSSFAIKKVALKKHKF